MDSYSIFDHGPLGDVQVIPSLPVAPPGDSLALPPISAERIRFPREDDGQSLAEMAEQDLQATLQLLAERAQYITGASGAAIALRADGEMVCRASAGPCAPELGAQLEVSSGLTGESVRTRQILRCDDAETDPRVNRESCRSLGILSLMVMPLIREAEVVGVFELLAGRPCAFEDRDVIALERLAEIILTALDHAAAAKRAPQEIADNEPIEEESRESKTESKTLLPEPTVPEKQPPQASGSKSASNSAVELEGKPAAAPVIERPRIKQCADCGFPISEGRTLCVDCEVNHAEAGNPAPRSQVSPPAFLGQLETAQPNWLQAHIYTIGICLMAALTVVILLLRFR